MAGPDQNLDGGNLRRATRDSCGFLVTLLSDLVKCAPVAVQYRLLAAQSLPPLYRYIYVLRVN
jgi:hypothetical protein